MATSGTAVGMVAEMFQCVPAVNLCSVQPGRNSLEYFKAILHIHFAYTNGITSTFVECICP